MAKNKLESHQIDELDKGPGFFKKLFLFVVIPLLFTIAILLIMATFTSTNVFQMANKLTESLPFISTSNDKLAESVVDEQDIVKLQAELQDKEAEVQQMQSKIDASTEEQQALIVEQERLLFEIEKLKRVEDETKREFNDILSTFEKMPAKKAAPILVQMSDTEALRILANLKPDTLAEILTKMTPTNAAKYTELLAKQ